MSVALIGRDLRTRALHETALPIGLDAAAMPGAVVHGDDGQNYTSMRWPTLSDPYTWRSATQIAEDVTAQVFRAIDQDLVIVVDPSLSEVEGQRYQSLGEALQYLSGFQPIYRADWSDPLLNPNETALRVRIELCAGYSIAEQILFSNINLGWVGIHAVDPVVPVIASNLTKMLSGPATQAGAHPVFQASGNSALPQIVAFRMVCDSSTVPADPDINEIYTPHSVGILLGEATSLVASSEFDAAANLMPGGRRAAGVDGFWRNVYVRRGGFFVGTGFTCKNATHQGIVIETGGTGFASYCEITGCATNSVIVGGGNFISGGVYTVAPELYIPGFYDQDFRKTPGVDSTSDIVVTAGGTARIGNPNARGGINIPPWSYLPQGFIADVRAPQTAIVDGIIKPKPYTVLTAPDPTAYTGHEIYVSNGAAGLPILSFSDGTNWLRCDTRTAISET